VLLFKSKKNNLKNTSFQRAPFGKVYKMIWFPKLSLPKQQMLLNHLKGDLESPKTIYKSFELQKSSGLQPNSKILVLISNPRVVTFLLKRIAKQKI
jgi:hypothetical protein